VYVTLGKGNFHTVLPEGLVNHQVKIGADTHFQVYVLEVDKKIKV
jgi:hypothetical protein